MALAASEQRTCVGLDLSETAIATAQRVIALLDSLMCFSRSFFFPHVSDPVISWPLRTLRAIA